MAKLRGLKTFQERWKGFDLNYEVTPATLGEDGLGCSKSLLKSIEKAIEDGTKDFYLFLEDDGVPFASATPRDLQMQPA